MLLQLKSGFLSCRIFHFSNASKAHLPSSPPLDSFGPKKMHGKFPSCCCSHDRPSNIGEVLLPSKRNHHAARSRLSDIVSVVVLSESLKCRCESCASASSWRCT